VPMRNCARPVILKSGTLHALTKLLCTAAVPSFRSKYYLVNRSRPRPSHCRLSEKMAQCRLSEKMARCRMAMPPLQRALVTLAALSMASSGAAPPVCTSGLDCSLNGICSKGACDCDVGFIGQRCELFDFLPTPRGSAFHSPGIENATSSWGGTAVFDPSTKVWHGFFSEFHGGCGVLSWETNSQIVRGIASTPLGPFVRQGVAIAAESHNAEARRDPKSGEWLLLHIGDGAKGGTTSKAGSSSSVQCANGSTSSCTQCADAPPYHCEGKNFPWRCCQNSTTTFPAGNATAGLSILHHSRSPLGPWVPLSKNLSLANLQPAYCSDNPTSYIAPNGTMFVLAVCHLPNRDDGERSADVGAAVAEGLPSVLMLWRAESWQGEFVQIGNVTRSNGPGEKQWSWVDPTVWLDHRGNVHVVANMGVSDQSSAS
jgi:hypothetical protein